MRDHHAEKLGVSPLRYLGKSRLDRSTFVERKTGIEQDPSPAGIELDAASAYLARAAMDTCPHRKQSSTA